MEPDETGINNSTMVEFCRGMPMSMFMDGFHWSLHHPSHQDNNSTATMTPPDCLIYFVTGWVLDDADKFKGAGIFSFLLALCMEILSAIRGVAAHYLHQSRWIRFLGLTLIYGLQAFLGYLLMFLSMTFSIEILLAAIVGLCVGNLAFFRYEDFAPPRRRRVAVPMS
jgi:hypothetical protein